MLTDGSLMGPQGTGPADSVAPGMLSASLAPSSHIGMLLTSMLLGLLPKRWRRWSTTKHSVPWFYHHRYRWRHPEWWLLKTAGTEVTPTSSKAPPSRRWWSLTISMIVPSGDNNEMADAGLRAHR